MENINIETGEIIEVAAVYEKEGAPNYEVDIVTGKVTAEVFTRTEAGLIALRGRYPATLDPHQDYEVIAGGVKEIKGLRVAVEKTRKEIKEPFLKGGKIIDAEAKRITLELERVLDPLLDKKRIVDDEKAIAEAKRLAALDAKAAAILTFAKRAEYGSLVEISEALEAITNIDTLNGFYERQLVACENKAAAIEMLNAALIRRNEQDARDREAVKAREAAAAMQAELDAERAKMEAERAAQAEELRKEREELAKLRAEAERMRQAEQARIDAAEEAKIRADAEEFLAEECAKLDAEQTALELAASEAEQARRERNKPDAEKLREWHEESIKNLKSMECLESTKDLHFKNVIYLIEDAVNREIRMMVGEL